MKEKTKLRVIQILCIVSLLITVFSIQKTYAKYFEKIDTSYQTQIKKWVVNVNNQNIHRKESLTEIMTPEFRANEHMNNNNTLVPGREGYFDFLIDYSNVELAFKFEVDIKQLNTMPLEDFEIYGYSIVETNSVTGEETETITELETPNNMAGLRQIIDPSTDVNNNNEKKRRIRILFRWNDDNADTEDTADKTGMNNYEDTVFAGEVNTNDLHELLKYNVKITFTQYLGNAGSN